MPNINKNIIKQAGAAVANATNKAAGLSASTPEPGSIISAIQLVNGGRKMGPTDIAHFTESVRNKLSSLLVNMEPIQSGAGTPSPDNVRPISGRTGLTIYVSPTPNAADATTYAVDWTSQAGTVYGGTLDVVTGVLTVDRATETLSEVSQLRTLNQSPQYGAFAVFVVANPAFYDITAVCCIGSSCKGVSYDNRTSNPTTARCYVDGSNSVNLRAPKDVVISDLSDMFNYFNGTQIVYELATPLTYQLTRTDIVTLVGDNYIWSDSGDVTITE